MRGSCVIRVSSTVSRPTRGQPINRTELKLEDIRVCAPSMKTKESHGKFIRMIDTTIAPLELEVS